LEDFERQIFFSLQTKTADWWPFCFQILC